MKAEKGKSNGWKSTGGRSLLLLPVFLPCHPSSCLPAASPPVLQSDFGLKDGAVAAMKGAAVGINPDLTHEIPGFNAREGAYRRWHTAPYWPAGTVFVSVVNARMGSISSRPTRGRPGAVRVKAQ